MGENDNFFTNLIYLFRDSNIIQIVLMKIFQKLQIPEVKPPKHLLLCIMSRSISTHLISNTQSNNRFCNLRFSEIMSHIEV